MGGHVAGSKAKRHKATVMSAKCTNIDSDLKSIRMYVTMLLVLCFVRILAQFGNTSLRA